MHKRPLVLTVLLIIACAASPTLVAAQADAEPVTRVVLFYSPNCVHCHQVVTELLEPLMKEYGEQLQIAGIDTSQPGGAQLYQAAIQWYQIPDERLGTPTLVVGDAVLVGSLEITNQFPDLVKEGLDGDGIDWPDFAPGLAELVARAGPTLIPEPTPGGTEDPGSVAATQPGTDETVCRDVLEGCEEQEGSAELASDVPKIYGPSPAAANNPTDAGRAGAVRLVFFWADT